MGKTFHMSADEKRLVREMVLDRKMSRTEAAKVMGRDLSAICRLLDQSKVPNPVGRPRGLTKEQVDKIVTLLEKMVDEADANYEVSLEMLARRSRTKACDRVVANASHERGYWFRDLRCKPILLPEDVKARFKFSKKYRNKTTAWWRRAIHIHVDSHHFKVATTALGRKLLAKRQVRGVYRKRGKALRSGHVKPNPKMKLATGAKGILKAAGVGGGKCLVFHTVEGRWGGDAAEELYTEVMTPALKAHYPGKKSFTKVIHHLGGQRPLWEQVGQGP